ncbi:MAG: hypothetical protein KA191_08425 [Verrucomicrobia bacterium]|nr:hypothetical protein [Verrucomicrobiota bacterium]NMD20949.1 hypothetical protein [Verrucomicrobiota bacterium]HOA62397.1 hypothetical protein [Verrucomicrobiota bacterium]HOF49446.1 hypothetical protein [Verrucomicrobiota bacterium]HOR72482.1 hypothetical protein [Verrucomicrobiota bacterium]
MLTSRASPSRGIMALADKGRALTASAQNPKARRENAGGLEAPTAA